MPRQRIIPYKERIQERIDVGMIVGKLHKHIQDSDKTPLLATQLNAARILLNKVVPDVQSLKIQEVTDDNLHTISSDKLRQIIQGEYKVIDNT